MERQLVANEKFGDWENCHIRLIQESIGEYVIEVVYFEDNGSWAQRWAEVTLCYGPPQFTFLRAIWADDAMCLLNFASKHLPQLVE